MVDPNRFYRPIEVIGDKIHSIMGHPSRVIRLSASLENNIQAQHFDKAGKIVKKLERTGDSKAIQPLIMALTTNNYSLTKEIEETIPKFGFEAIDPLIGTLEHENEFVRSEVVKILTKMGSQAVEPLLNALNSENALTREGAAKALGDIRDTRAVIPLIAKLNDNPDVVIAAVTSLGHLSDKRSVKHLIPLTQHKNKQLRIAVIKALGELRDTTAFDSLVNLLSDEDLLIRENTARSLETIGTWAINAKMSDVILQKMSDVILQKMSDADNHIKIRIIETLSLVGKIATQPLLVALDDFHWQVRLAAAKSFSCIQMHYDETVENKFMSILQDPHVEVRQAIASTILNLANTHYYFEGFFNLIVRSLEHTNSLVRYTMIVAIADYLQSLDVRTSSFPTWFEVIKDDYSVRTSKSVKTILNMLTKLSQDSNKEVSEKALSVLITIHDKLEQKRHEGPTDTKHMRIVGPFGKKKRKNQFDKELYEEKTTAETIEYALRQRYAVCIFYSNMTQKMSVPDGNVLKADQWYQLEVAVRAKPVGIPSEELERLPIQEPKQKHDVTIYVTVEGDGFEVKEPIQTLILPPFGDSKVNANFRVRPIRKSLNNQDLAELWVRLYYNFNLLEVLVIRAEVVGKSESTAISKFGLKKPISLRQERLECEYRDFDEIYPRAMHIDVTKRGDHYFFNFLFFNEDDQKVVFTAPVYLSASDLEDDLVNIRTILHNISMRKIFAQQVKGNEDIISDIRKLARAGVKLWGKLFYFNIESSLYWIGKWLQEHPLKKGGIIQISVDHGASDFVFPWGILYDRQLPVFYEELNHRADLPDLEGFWGIRYCIEQRLPTVKPTVNYTDEPSHVKDRLKLGFMLREDFPNSKKQISLIKRLAKQSRGRLLVTTPPITQVDKCYKLLKDCDAEILYFYTHGYTRSREADIGVGPDLEEFVRIFEGFSETDPRYRIYQKIYEKIKRGQFDKKDSWIGFQYGKLYLKDLICEITTKFRCKPLVILNMCESAQITPSLSDSFIDFFIDRGAKSVIGTECPMTTTFAHPFAAWLLEGVLKGEQIGISMLNARRHFLLELKNPLGLAYTIFGSATTSFEPKLIEVNTN